MDSFHLKEIVLAFKEIDAGRKEFRLLFYKRILPVLHHFHPPFLMDEKSDEVLNSYAIQIQNLTESIIDKDNTYPEYRINDELANTTRIASQNFDANDYAELYEQLLKTVRALMVENNNEVYNLSATGFRLMEANAKVFSQQFISDLSTLPQLNTL